MANVEVTIAALEDLKTRLENKQSQLELLDKGVDMLKVESFLSGINNQCYRNRIALSGLCQTAEKNDA